MSVSPGDMINMRISTFSPNYTVRILRLQRRLEEDPIAPSGLIDGVVVGRLVTREAPAGGHFKKPQNITSHRTGAGWATDGADIPLPANAKSGFYAAELTTASGGRFLAPFIVRPRPGRG